MDRLRRLLVIALAVSVALMLVAAGWLRSGNNSGASRYESEVKTHPSQGPVQTVPGARATLVTSENGAGMTFRSLQLKPGHVYTAWWVVVNQPSACVGSPCTGADVLSRTAAVQADITYGGGHVGGEDGRLNLSSYLPAGDMPDGWFGNGFTNPTGADIHIVIMDHGPKLPDLVSNQLSSFRGGCTDESLPPAFPDTAKSDGVPGPNACGMVQVAVFAQD